MSGANSRKRILLLGATGSIGSSVLNVLREHPSDFELLGATANTNAEGLAAIRSEFHLAHAVLVSENASASAGLNRGRDALLELVGNVDYDLLVNALIGGAGIEPTLIALERGIDVALANKETLVAAGPLVMEAARSHGANVIPIDSEHSAILQCLTGERRDFVRRIWLTTSGGPFWGKTREQLAGVSVEDALRHPRWKMGAKITIDSATLLNKGLEVIETQRLFELPAESIRVVKHGEHIVHSFVEFIDGSFKAQLGTPDMRIPVLYALTWPSRLPSELVATDPTKFNSLNFEPVNIPDYPCLELAYKALEAGDDCPAALSAADEIAVEAFLKNQIMFNDIWQILAGVMAEWRPAAIRTISNVLSADKKAREAAKEQVLKLSRTGASIC